jgi:hypothetical protein
MGGTDLAGRYGLSRGVAASYFIGSVLENDLDKI